MANQTQNLAAILSNFSTAIEATEVALNSAGSASQENERVMDSLNAKLSQLQSTFQDLSNNVIDSDLVKGILDIANAFLQLINTPIGTFVTQVTLLTTAIWGFTQVVGVMNIFDNIKTQILALSTSLPKIIAGFKGLIAAMTATTSATTAATTATSAFAAAQAAAFPIIGIVVAAVVGAIAVIGGLAAAVDSATVSLEEQKEIVNELKEELQTLQSEYDTLASKTDLTEADEKRLKILEAQIEANKIILQQEAEKQYVMEFGGGSQRIESAYVDASGAQMYTAYTGLEAIEADIESFERLQQSIAEVENELLSFGEVTEENAGKVNELTKEKDELTTKSTDLYNAITSEIQKLEELGASMGDSADPIENLPEEAQQVYEAYVKMLEKFVDVEEGLEDLGETAFDVSTSYDALLDSTSEVLTQMSDLDSAYKTLSSAVDEYNANGVISAETLNSLMSMEEDYLSMLVIEEGKLKVNTKALEDKSEQLRKTAIEEAKSAAANQLHAIAVYGVSEAIDETSESSEQGKETMRGYKDVLDQVAIGAINAATGVGMIAEIFSDSPLEEFTEAQTEAMETVFNNFAKVYEWFGKYGTGSGDSVASSISSATDPIKEQNDLFSERIDILEHELYLMEQQGKSDTERLTKLKQIQDTLHEQADWFRSQGFSEESEYIRDLQKAWWEVQQQIQDVREEQTQRYEESVTYLEHELFLMEKNGASNEEMIEQLKILQFAAHQQAEKLRAEGVEDNDERIQQLQQQWWGYQDQIDAIYDEIAQSAQDAADEAKEAWEEAHQATIDSLEQQISDYETAFAYVVKQIEKKLEELYEKQEAYELLSDYMVSQIDKEIEALEQQRDEEEQYWDDKIAALEQQNEELNEQIALEEALDELARAKQSKVMVYKDGRFQYVQDTQAVSDAQLKLEQLKREQEYKDAIEALEEQKEQAIAVIDEQIEAWNKYREEWASLVDDYIEEKNKLLIEQQLGIKLEGDNWKNWVNQFDKYGDEYKDLLDNQIGKWEEYKDEWSSVLEDYQDTQDKLLAEQLLGIDFENNNWETRLDNLQQFVDEYIRLLEELKNAQEDVYEEPELPDGGGGPYDGMTYDEVVAKMRENAQKWHNATTQTEKDYYHAQNQYLGSLIGANYDPATGTWDVLQGSYSTGGIGTTNRVEDINNQIASGTHGNLYFKSATSPETSVLSSANTTATNASLWSLGGVTPSQQMQSINGLSGSTSKTVNITIDNFNPDLSNVTNGQDFADYLSRNFLRQVVQYQTV